MTGIVSEIIVLVGAVALATSSVVSSAPAPTSTGPAPVTMAHDANPWLTLSAMTTSSSSASAAAAPGEAGSEIGFPPAAPLTAILATIATAIYILLDDDRGNLEPISPA